VAACRMLASQPCAVANTRSTVWYSNRCCCRAAGAMTTLMLRLAAIHGIGKFVQTTDCGESRRMKRLNNRSGGFDLFSAKTLVFFPSNLISTSPLTARCSLLLGSYSYRLPKEKSPTFTKYCSVLCTFTQVMYGMPAHHVLDNVPRTTYRRYEPALSSSALIDRPSLIL
jgi:hypothetical protein